MRFILDRPDAMRIETIDPVAVVEARTRYAPNACPGHVASASDPKICAHCGTHVREEADTEEDSP